MAANKIKLVDLDPEVLATLKGGSSSDIAKLMTMYFDKRTDKVTEALVDVAYTSAIKKYSDDEDKKIKNSLANYRANNVPINENDLGAALANKINNCITTVNGLTSSSTIIAPDGSTVNLSTLYQKIASLQREIDGLKDSQSANSNILNEAKKYTDQKCAALQNNINQTNNDVAVLNNKFTNYRLKNTLITENDLDTALKNKITSSNESSDNLFQLIANLQSSSSTKNVDFSINANSSYTIDLNGCDTPERLNVSVYILDTQKDSRTYDKYVNAEGIITVSMTDDCIILYNDSDQQNIVKVIYYSTNNLESNIQDNNAN